MDEPRDGSICVWYQGNVPYAVMTRIDEYEEDAAPGERWFVADQYFTDSSRNSYGYTWEQAKEMLGHLDGPWTVNGVFRSKREGLLFP